MQKLNFRGTYWRGLALIGAPKKTLKGIEISLVVIIPVILAAAASPQPATHQGPTPNVCTGGATTDQGASSPHNNPKVVISQEERALAERALAERAGKKRKEPIVPALVSATQEKGDEGVSATKRPRVEPPAKETPNQPVEADVPMPEPVEKTPGMLAGRDEFLCLQSTYYPNVLIYSQI